MDSGSIILHMMNFEEPAVRMEGLRVTRGGHEVLHGVSLSIERGSLVALIGPSGCGKTTLMRALMGVQQHVTGEIEVLGLPAGNPRLRRRIGYMSQGAGVFTDLTVRQNLRYFGSVLGTSDEQLDRVLDKTDLRSQADQLTGSLSGGQTARVSLGIALLGSPELLLLDEPTVGLDPVLRVELWSQFHQLAVDGTTLLVSSHVMDEATRCDRLVLMRGGQILAAETPTDLMARTRATDVEEAFITLINDPGASPSELVA